MNLDEKILKLRNSKGWSQIDIAHRLEISQSAYNKWESGQAKPTLKNLQKLSNVFEISFLDLFPYQFSEKFLNSSQLNITTNKNSLKLINKIIDNQQLITELMKDQSILIENLLKNNL